MRATYNYSLAVSCQDQWITHIEFSLKCLKKEPEVTFSTKWEQGLKKKIRKKGEVKFAKQTDVILSIVFLRKISSYSDSSCVSLLLFISCSFFSSSCSKYLSHFVSRASISASVSVILRRHISICQQLHLAYLIFGRVTWFSGTFTLRNNSSALSGAERTSRFYRQRISGSDIARQTLFIRWAKWRNFFRKCRAIR